MSNHFTGFSLVCALVMTVVPQANAMQGMQGMQGMHRMHGDTACSTNVTQKFGFVIPGIMWANLDNVNDYLASRGISRFKSITPTLSIGGHKEKKRLVFESSLTLRYWRDRVNSNLRTTLMAGDMVWNTGINVLPAAFPMICFPYLGLGVGLASMHFRNDTKTLERLLESSEPNAMLWQASFLLNAGGGTDILLKKGKERGIALGIRAGYLFDPFSGNEDRDWWSGGTRIGDVPLLKQNGPYIRLMVGGW